MSNKKTKQPVEIEAAVKNDETPKESAVLADEAPRNIVFEEALEAILFAAGHPISYATLARVFEMTPSKVRDRVLEFSLKYNNSEIPRGVILLTLVSFVLKNIISMKFAKRSESEKAALFPLPLWRFLLSLHTISPSQECLSIH